MQCLELHDANGNLRGLKFIHSYRDVSGKSRKVSSVLKPDATIREITLAKYDLIKRAEDRSSLTCSKVLFEDVVETLKKKPHNRPWRSIFGVIEKELSGPIGPVTVKKFERLCSKLDADRLADNTKANYSEAVMMVLHYAYNAGLIDVIPIRKVEMRRTYRTRVLTRDEALAIENIMVATGNPLLWGFRLSMVRPIRENDLWDLTPANLQLFGDTPHIRFYQEKTYRRTGRFSTLPLADLPVILAYLRQLPTGSQYLFPDPDGGRMRNFQGRWESVRDAAKCGDVHWHDLKRVATTYMLSTGYTDHEIQRLGISSLAMIRKCYDATTAEDIMQRHAGKNVVFMSSSEKAAI